MAGFGGSIKLTGESDYKKALKEITDNLTVLSSEMKVVTSQYERNDTSTANLAQQNEVLNKRLDEQNKKLAEAKKMLQEATTAENANAQTINKWQNEVNKAQAEVNSTTRAIEKNTNQIEENEKALSGNSNELQEFTANEEKAGLGALKLGDLIKANLISEVIIGGIKKLGSAIASIAGKFVDVGKQAIGSYADYEQLIGGVETLFKDSAGTVENYANEAFKTAGLSANDYMETVTSFSASLLQSLGQDTEASAKYANQAIIDMSDNANKMGTDMASIQNAYQGFAKQNYTMLDNLKLGYGGTKTEMERLIADANKVKQANGEMANLSINSFADVVEAIHTIQTEMGITGTTAKEASTTISGSVNSMKSAWHNLLTGIADDNADFGALIDNFVESILTVAQNLLPRIQTVVQGMGQLVSGLMTQLVPELVNAIPPLVESTLPVLVNSIQTMVDSVIAALPQLLTAIENILPILLNAIVSMLPSLINAGIQIILSLVQGIAKSLPTLIPAIVDAIMTIVDTLLDNIDLIIETGFQLLLGLGEGLINAIPKLIERLPEIIESIITNLYTFMPKLIEAGVQLAIQLSIGMVKAIPQIVAKIPEILTGIFKGFSQGLGQFKDIGINIIKGIIDGMFSWLGNLWESVKNIANTVVGWFKNLFGIHSPSTVFADQIGKNMALGIGEGFEDTMADVTSQMAEAVPTSFDVNTNTQNGPVQTTLFADMVDAFKEALKEVNIVLDDEVAGKFVTDTVERVVYS